MNIKVKLLVMMLDENNIYALELVTQEHETVTSV